MLIISSLLCLFAAISFSSSVFASFVSPQLYDFGHVPAGAKRHLQITVCSLKDNPDTLRLLPPPKGFHFNKTPRLLHFNKNEPCQKLQLFFASAKHLQPHRYYGYQPDSRGWQLDPEYRLTGIAANGRKVLLSQLTAISLSGQAWESLYPANVASYIYQTLLQHPPTVSVEGFEHHLPSPARGDMVKDIVFDHFDNLYITYSNNTTDKLGYLPYGRWLQDPDFWIKKGFCGLSLTQNDFWLAAADTQQLMTFSTYASVYPGQEPVSTLDDHSLPYRICHSAFTRGDRTLLTLAGHQGSHPSTHLTSWSFSPLTGQISRNVISSPQVGRTSEMSMITPVKALVISANHYVVAHHLHSNKTPHGRFYLHPDSGKLTEMPMVKTDIAVNSMDGDQNGQFLVFTPAFNNLSTNNPIEIHECFSAGCERIQTLDKHDVSISPFVPSDARFAHHSTLLAATAEEGHALVIFRQQEGINRWQEYQTLPATSGIPMLKGPKRLTFSPDDEWLAVATSNNVLLFGKNHYHRMKKRFTWPQPSEWWQGYLSRLCQTDPRVRNKQKCQIQ